MLDHLIKNLGLNFLYFQNQFIVVRSCFHRNGLLQLSLVLRSRRLQLYLIQKSRRRRLQLHHLHHGFVRLFYLHHIITSLVSCKSFCCPNLVRNDCTTFSYPNCSCKQICYHRSPLQSNLQQNQ